MTFFLYLCKVLDSPPRHVLIINSLEEKFKVY